MAKRETVEEALKRWDDLEKLQEFYANFDDFLVAVIEEVMGFKCTQLQLDIGEYIAQGPKYRMVQAQRSQAKTTIAAAAAVWKLIHNPKTRVLIISAGDTQATEIATWIIQIINNMDELSCMRPDRNNGDRASVEAFDVHYSLKGAEKSPSVACIGITSNMQGKRADYLLGDDVESQKNAATQVQRDRLILLTRDFTSIVQNGEIVYLGTPQTNDSIYNTLPDRGYDIRIWPGRYPTESEIGNYGTYLAPRIRMMMELDPTLRTGGGPDGTRGKPTDPELLGEEALVAKEIDQGAAYFQLQHMLDTRLSDEGRYPLKTGLLRFATWDRELGQVPMNVTWARTLDNMIEPAPGHPVRDKRYRAIKLDDWAQLKGPVMYVDPAGGGANADEVAVAVVGYCGGRVYVLYVGGIVSGIDEKATSYVIGVAKQWNVKTVIVEKNYGNGAFRNILEPLLLKEHKCGVEEVWESGQKELRIIDILEPIIGAGKLVVHEEVFNEDWESTSSYPNEKRSSYSMFWQLSRISRQRGALTHDDRLDALAGAVRYWVDGMNADDEKVVAAAREEQWRKMMQDPLGTGRTPGGFGSVVFTQQQSNGTVFSNRKHPSMMDRLGRKF